MLYHFKIYLASCLAAELQSVRILQRLLTLWVLNTGPSDDGRMYLEICTYVWTQRLSHARLSAARPF